MLARVAAPPPSLRPNIVFIISDDHAWTDYGFMGHPQIETPHLDKLASRSALSPAAMCPPRCAGPRWPHLPPDSTRISTRSAATIPALLPAMIGARQARKAGATRRVRRTAREAHREFDHHPTIPKLLGRAGLSQPSVRQMVGRQLPARRLHPRHDARFSEARRPPRR